MHITATRPVALINAKAMACNACIGLGYGMHHFMVVPTVLAFGHMAKHLVLTSFGLSANN